jgi:ribosomal protein L28
VSVKRRIETNVTSHTIVKPNGRTVRVPSSSKYIAERVLGSQLGAAFARLISKDSK